MHRFIAVVSCDCTTMAEPTCDGLELDVLDSVTLVTILAACWPVEVLDLAEGAARLLAVVAKGEGTPITA